MDFKNLKLSEDDGTCAYPEDRPDEDERTKIPWSQRDIVPGQVTENGSWMDNEGVVHYESGVTVRPAERDNRLVKNGERRTQPYKKATYTKEEVEQNPFLALTPKEMTTLEFHLSGMRHAEIAQVLGCGEQTVMLRLAGPKVQSCLNVVRTAHRDEVKQLLSKVRDVYEDGLDDLRPFTERLATVKEINKVTGQYSEGEKDSQGGGNDMLNFINNLQVNIKKGA